jgi:hypothetical protein
MNKTTATTITPDGQGNHIDKLLASMKRVLDPEVASVLRRITEQNGVSCYDPVDKDKLDHQSDIATATATNTTARQTTTTTPYCCLGVPHLVDPEALEESMDLNVKHVRQVVKLQDQKGYCRATGMLFPPFHECTNMC